MKNIKLKIKYITSVFVLTVMLCTGCTFISKNQSSSDFDDKDTNYQSYLYETCNKLNESVKNDNINDFRSLLSDDLSSEMSDDDIENLIEFLNENEIDFNPYEKENLTGKARLYSHESICLFGEIDYYDVEGKDGNKYKIRIERCFYFEGVSVPENINYFRIMTEENSDLKYEYGKAW